MTDRTRDTLRIATEIQRAESLEQMLSIVLRHVGAWVRYDRAAIALSDAAGNYLEWVEIDEDGRSRADSGRMVPIRPTHPLGGVMLDGKPYLRTGLAGRGPVPMDAMEESVSRLIVPLVGEFSTLGVLDVHASKEDAFTEQDLQTLAHYARLIAAALETQRDLERSRQLSLMPLRKR